MPKIKRAEEISLIPRDFSEGTKRVLSNSKRESDKQLAEFQADNAKKREAKKKR